MFVKLLQKKKKMVINGHPTLIPQLLAVDLKVLQVTGGSTGLPSSARRKGPGLQGQRQQQRQETPAMGETGHEELVFR